MDGGGGPQRFQRLIEELFDAAGLPYIRVLTSRTYDTRELEATIGPYLQAGIRR